MPTFGLIIAPLDVMTYLKFFLFVLSVTWFMDAQAISCKKELIGDVLKTGFNGFLKIRKDLEMYTKIEPPKDKPAKKWILLIHGLMDSHQGWNDITPMLNQKGIGVIRVDLEGFAETLVHNRRANDSFDYEIPYEFNYQRQVENLVLILKELKKLGIERPAIAGHSMGGGLAASLASNNSAKRLISDKLFLFAPYVYRLERRVIEQAFEQMDLGGLMTVSNFVNLFMKSTAELISNSPYRPTVESMTTDPIVDSTMRVKFREFFEQKLKERGIRFESQTEKELVIRAHVDAGIAAVKGLRDMDNSVIVQNIKKSIDVYQVVPLNDHLLDPGIQRALRDSFPTNKVDYIEVDAGHMVINELPNRVSDIIVEGLLDQ